jgi:hypothetical protein
MSAHLGQVLSTLATAIAALTVSFTAAFAGPDLSVHSNRLRVDPWGIELTDFCDLRDGAPISDMCYGFVAGVLEVMLAEELTRAPNEERRLCLLRVDVKVVIAKIRPGLRKYGVCAGFCTSQSYVATEIYRAYPCRSSEH